MRYAEKYGPFYTQLLLIGPKTFKILLPTDCNVISEFFLSQDK